MAFLESLGMEGVLVNVEEFVRIRTQKRYFYDNFLIITHLGVVKVGLFWLAKPEVICQRMIFTKKEVRCKINYRSTLTTPNINEM